MALSKDSIRKLRAVKAAILAEPELYDQNEPPNYAYQSGGCGAPCCFLGWALWIDNPDPKAYADRVDSLRAEDFVPLLGVTPRQADLLFSTGYYTRKGVWTPIGSNAKKGARRLDRFIATGGER